jgi:LacI family transcriptional regulator
VGGKRAACACVIWLNEVLCVWIKSMVTQAEIARKLGLSRQLVTFALSGYPQVAAKSRKRILEAAREMGYRPNPHAQALRKRRTGIVALWIPDQISTHYTHVARELGRLVKQAHTELVICEVGLSEAGQILSHVPVDGIVAVDPSPDVLLQLERLREKAMAVVCITAAGGGKADLVQVDLKTGTQELLAHMIERGFRRIAHATFVRKNAPEESRRMEYLRAMRQAGLKPEFVYYPLCEQQRSLTRQLIRDYIQTQGMPEAIFCHSDDVAVGVYRGLCDLKLRVPQDVALAGCDGIQDTEYLDCPLTTLVQPVAEMCATAWQFLQQRLATPGLPCQHALLKPRLEVRESTARSA